MPRTTVQRCCLVVVLLVSCPLAAQAAGTNLPWESPLTQIADSVTGPVAKFGGLAALTFFGLGLALTEGSAVLHRIMWIVVGLAIAFNAASWGLSFLGFSGGALV
jgi:type IV secretory pathway VirB2 component (pilin)